MCETMTRARKSRLICICAIGVPLVYITFSKSGRSVMFASLQPGSSDLDWCEENYVVVPFIAEFFNTTSSLLVFLVGFSVANMFSQGGFIRMRSSGGFLLLAMLTMGLGSTYFHACLSRLGQVLDEVSMCWTNTWILIHIRCPKRATKMFGERVVSMVSTWYYLAAVVVTTLVIGLTCPLLSHVVTLATLIGIILSFRVAIRGLSSKAQDSIRPTYICAIVCIIVGLCCWMVDFLGCSTVRDMVGFNPQLHAIWHALIFAALHYSIAFTLYVVSEESKRRCNLRSVMYHQADFWEMAPVQEKPYSLKPL